MSSNDLIKNIILDGMFMAIGVVCIYVGIKSFMQQNHPAKVGTGLFWILVGVILGFGNWIQKFAATIFPTAEGGLNIGSTIIGGIIVLMTLPAIFGKVKAGENVKLSEEYSKAQSEKIGNAIFIPALTIGVMSLIFALLIPSIGAIPGLGVGIVVAGIIILVMSKDKPSELLVGGKRLIETVGPLSLLPMLLASLGAVFTAAGVGDIIAKEVGKIIPEGNVLMGIIIYALGMAIFTMIMGNAFAAFSVMTVGIGIPFVLKYGLDPNVVGMLALTCGFCGTLCTPMAANFNIVPVAVLEMKDKYGVIKNQILIAVCMLVVQIILINVLG